MTLEAAWAQWPTLSVPQRTAVVEQVIRAGAFADAEVLVADMVRRTPGPEAQFLLGALRKAQGRVAEAIEIYRAILADRPQLARVRLELAHALFLAEQDESARHHFDLVRNTLTNTDVDRVVQGFVDAMDRRRRWHANAYVSLAPSTNFNQGADARSVAIDGLAFTLDPNARKQSGVGLTLGVNAGYLLPLTERLDLVIAGGANARQYTSDVFNDYVVSGEIGPRYRFPWGEVGLYLTGGHRWYSRDDYQLGRAPATDGWAGADPFATMVGGRLAVDARLGPAQTVSSSLGCVDKRHDTFVWQDGLNCSARISVDHGLDAGSFLRVLGGVEQEDAETEHLAYQAGHVGLGLYREIAWGVTVYAEAVYTRRDYDGLYPTATEARQDDRVDASLTLTKRDWKVFGLAPSLQYSYTVQESNVVTSTFDAHSLNVTLTRKF
jgi:tetratricopeptide (TPR) repeat protein